MSFYWLICSGAKKKQQQKNGLFLILHWREWSLGSFGVGENRGWRREIGERTTQQKLQYQHSVCNKLQLLKDPFNAPGAANIWCANIHIWCANIHSNHKVIINIVKKRFSPCCGILSFHKDFNWSQLCLCVRAAVKVEQTHYPAQWIVGKQHIFSSLFHAVSDMEFCISLFQQH